MLISDAASKAYAEKVREAVATTFLAIEGQFVLTGQLSGGSLHVRVVPYLLHSIWSLANSVVIEAQAYRALLAVSVHSIPAQLKPALCAELLSSMPTSYHPLSASPLTSLSSSSSSFIIITIKIIILITTPAVKGLTDQHADGLWQASVAWKQKQAQPVTRVCTKLVTNMGHKGGMPRRGARADDWLQAAL